ncbi:hypothetical protein [Ferrimonas sp. YFM]|uniref:hypothetical protein n=1 Tax=Ferrimonas sp. YFM TaxID=3028878 RepID=UPI0025736DD9|nr:hypothetical protein [Ferrimonas sp. YFM]BDY05433.1 hypothetical protein F0521_24740 [Ferrimonas sp. YFM]
MKRILAICCFLLLSACVSTGISKTTRMSDTGIHGLQHNSVLQKFTEMPTTVTAYGDNDTVNMLSIYVERYGGGNGYLYVSKSNADEYLVAIRKYLEWEQIALQRKDLLNKEIATIDDEMGSSFRFTIWSGNKQQHLLYVEPVALGMSTGYGFYLDSNSAAGLKELIDRLANASIRPQQHDLIYK